MLTHKRLSTVVTAIASVLLLTSGTLAICLLLLKFHHQEMLTVESGSMTPTFRRYDAIIVDTQPTGLRAGDIVSYRSKLDNRMIVSHRLLAFNKLTSRLTTKGDNLDQPDPAISGDQLIGQVVDILPGFGRILNLYRSKLGLCLSVYLPALMITVTELWHALNNIWPEKYRLHGYRRQGVRLYA
jgi:signal peptidase I